MWQCLKNIGRRQCIPIRMKVESLDTTRGTQSSLKVWVKHLNIRQAEQNMGHQKTNGKQRRTTLSYIHVRFTYADSRQKTKANTSDPPLAVPFLSKVEKTSIKKPTRKLQQTYINFTFYFKLWPLRFSILSSRPIAS